MRRLIHLTLTLLLAAFALAPLARAAGAPSVHALLIAGSKGGGASDPRLSRYEANLKSSMPFDTFKLLGEGSGDSVIALPNGHRIQLDSVRGGEAQIFGVSAIVLPQPMPSVLLGNSFLNRFQMQKNNDQLTLEKRF